MNKELIIGCLKRIHAIIESARASDKAGKNKRAYASGLRMCDEMIETIEGSKKTLPFGRFFGRFDRYITDSLPWTGNTLETIEAERRKIRRALK